MSSTLATVSALLDAAARAPLVVDIIVKSTLLVLIGVVLARLLRRSPASARHLVWTLTIGGVLALPAAVAWMPWRVETRSAAALRDALPTLAGALLPASPAALGTTGSPRQIGDPLPQSLGRSPVRTVGAAAGVRLLDETRHELNAPTGPAGSALATLAARLTAPDTLLGVLWALGFLWTLGRLVIGVSSVRWTVRAARPVSGSEWRSLVDRARRSIGTGASPRIVISERAVMPFSFGIARPVIVLPAAVAQWTMDRRRSVLMHELAHLRRRDLLVNAAVQVACAVYWFHPLVWVAARRVRIEAERACDDLVLAAGLRPSDYAGDLLEIARDVRWTPASSVALAMARRSDFEGRLLAILAPGSARRTLTAARTTLVVLTFSAPALAVAAAVPTGTAAARPASAADRIPRDAAQEYDGRLVPVSAGPSKPRVEDAAAPDPLSSRAARLATRVGVTALAKVLGSEPRIVPPSVVEDLPEPSVATPQARAGDTVVAALMATLGDTESGVRLAAVRALGELQDPRAIDALGEVLRTDTDAQVREAAAWALGEIESPRAVPALIAALRAERVAAVRARIVWALGQIEDVRAVEVVMTVLRDPEAEVRRQAVWALGEIESPAAVPGLIPLLRDSDAEVRRQVAWALGEIESADAVPALSAAVKDADAGVREQAVWALGEIESADAVPALSLAITDAEPAVRRKAVWALGEIDNQRSAPAGLIAAVRDTDREVRQGAARALGEIRDPEAVPALVVLSRDADVEVKRSAVHALAEIGGAQAIEAIVVLLKDDDPEIRRMAAEALGRR